MTVSQYDQNAPEGLNPVYSKARPHFAKWLIGGGALLVVLGGYWYWQNSGTARIPRVTAAPVRVALATIRDMAVIERTIGTVVPSASVQITSRVQGIVDEAHFKEGQMVRKGDLLFQIDPRSFIAALAQARATLAKDQAQLDAAANNEKRYRTLFDQSATSSQQLDTAVSTAASLVRDRRGRQALRCRYRPAQSRLHPHHLAGGRQDQRHHDPAGQHGRGQRHHHPGHDQSGEPDQSFLLAAPDQPAADPGARTIRHRACLGDGHPGRQRPGDDERRRWILSETR